MLECYDQDDLLAYIEDELAPDEAAAMQRRLQDDPPVAELVEAMRSDRARLLADPEPHPPVDFAAQLESMLVRPMLMEATSEAHAMPTLHRPGRERRRHRRQRQLRAIRKLAIAAAVALVAIGAVWTAYNNASLQRSPHTAATADAQSSGSHPSDGTRVAGADRASVERPATVHHHLPLPGPPIEANVAKGGHRQAAVSGDSERVALDFILVVQSSDVAQTEHLLTELTAGLAMPAALVQNFSYDEAKRLEQAWLRSQRTERQPTDWVAGTRRPDGITGGFDELAERARDQRRQGRTSVPMEMSRQLHGSREIAATLAQQLEYSSRGATHTITIPIEQLQAVLVGLANEQAHTTWLQHLTDEPATVDLSPSFSDRAAVQQSLAQIRSLGGGVLVHLPIKVTQ